MSYQPPDPDDLPSAADLIEIPPDRVTLAWCGTCAEMTIPTPRWVCLTCANALSAVTYEWVDES